MATRRRKRRIRYDRLAILIGGFLAIILTIFLIIHNRNTFFLMFKGYSKDERIVLLRQSDEDVKEYVHTDKIELSVWERYNNDEHFYDYVLYQEKEPEESVKNVIDYVDTFYENDYDALLSLGYNREWLRKKMSTFTLDDFDVLVNNKVTYKVAKTYLSVHGCVVSDIPKYIKKNKDSAIEAVLSVTYPFIDSSKEAKHTYQIVKPDKSYTVLIKDGFTLGEDYVPSDLVEVKVTRDKDYDSNNQLREAAETALENMFADAEDEGLHLVVRSAYRSYDEQMEIYKKYLQIYDYDYAMSLVAVPGSSEHQLGLGVDITSQSVIDGDYETFGYTKEYEWVMNNCYKYGYILRYPSTSTSLTGTTNEPWHFRYVGKDAAKEIYENDWTLEEYILKHGFDYNLTLVE